MGTRASSMRIESASSTIAVARGCCTRSAMSVTSWSRRKSKPPSLTDT
jgi:hypothetical protein